MLRYTLFVLIGLFFSSIYCFAGEVVTATGMSFFEPGREAIARERALDDAKRIALEQAVGVSIESQTLVENFQVCRDQVFSRASGYLKNVRILEENKSKLGSYTVKIQAEVEVASLVEDLDRFTKILSWQKNPRIRIVIDPNVPADFRAAAQKSINRLAVTLQNQGFRVFRGNSDGHFSMGLEVEVSLDLNSSESDYQGVALRLNEVAMTANIYRPGEREIVAAASAVKSTPGSNKLAALDKGAAECEKVILADLRKQLTRSWEKELYGMRTIDLLVKNVPTQGRASEIAAIIQENVSGIVSADLVHFSNTTAEYSVKFKGWTEQFLAEIQMSYFRHRFFDAKLDEISEGSLMITAN